MPNYLVTFDNGHEERVDNVISGDVAKSEARKRAGLAKDTKAAGGDASKVSKIKSCIEVPAAGDATQASQSGSAASPKDSAKSERGRS